MKFNDTRDWLQPRLINFRPHGEQETVARLLTLDYLSTHPRAFWRDEFTPGHFTASSWIINPTRTHTLLVLHKYLNIWIQLGGHADGNGNLYEMSLQEAAEETGLPASNFTLLKQGEIFDLAIVPIPANPKKNEPEHLHYDVRFAYELNDAIPLPPNPEGLTLRWLNLAEAVRLSPPDNTTLRMLAKTPSL